MSVKILEVKVKKFHCLENLESNVNGRNVFLIGENGLGKSSYINWIRFGLGDDRCLSPFENGEGSLKFEKDDKEYEVFIKIANGKKVIKIKAEDGFTSSNKGVLEHITGAMSFDIEEFVNKSGTPAGRREQIEMLKNLLPAAAKKKIYDLEQEYKIAYKEREDVNRDIKSLKGVLSACTQQESVEKPLPVIELTEQLSKAESVNREIEDYEKALSTYREGYKALKAEIAELSQKLAEKQEGLQGILNMSKLAKEKLESLSRVETEPLKQKIREQAEKAKKYAAYEAYQQTEIDLAFKQGMSAGYTSKLKTNLELVQTLIKQNNTAVPGLSIAKLGEAAKEEEVLVYNGQQVAEGSLSTSEIMELGFKLKMAENPELGILFIERAESLGQQKMDALLSLSKKNNMQLFIEEVQRGKETLEIRIEGENV